MLHSTVVRHLGPSQRMHFRASARPHVVLRCSETMQHAWDAWLQLNNVLKNDLFLFGLADLISAKQISLAIDIDLVRARVIVRSKVLDWLYLEDALHGTLSWRWAIELSRVINWHVEKLAVASTTLVMSGADNWLLLSDGGFFNGRGDVVVLKYKSCRPCLILWVRWNGGRVSLRLEEAILGDVLSVKNSVALTCSQCALLTLLVVGSLDISTNVMSWAEVVNSIIVCVNAWLCKLDIIIDVVL